MLGKGCGCQPTQSFLGSFFVVFPPPGLDDHCGMGQVNEPVLIQAFVAEATIERFDVGVLIGFSRLNQKQFHATSMCPVQHCPTAEFLTVVSADRLWQTALHRQSIQNARQGMAVQGTLRHLMTRPSAVRSNTKSIDQT